MTTKTHKLTCTLALALTLALRRATGGLVVIRDVAIFWCGSRLLLLVDTRRFRLGAMQHCAAVLIRDPMAICGKANSGQTSL